MKRYWFPPTRSLRVLWTLRELDVEFEFINVTPPRMPRLREFMDRMYQRPNAAPRIAEAFASLRR